MINIRYNGKFHREKTPKSKENKMNISSNYCRKQLRI